jgi:hypothetical protein
MAEAAEPAGRRDEVEHLLEASLARRGRRLPARERRVELGATLVFALVLGGSLAACGLPFSLDPLVLGLVAAYAVAVRVAYPVGTVSAVPTQLFVVPLFALVEAPVVPLLVFGALVLSTTVACLLGRSRWDRLLFAGGDSLHTFGPVAVLTLSGHAVGLHAPWPVLAGALVAQAGVDYLATTVRQWLISGVRPALQLHVLAQVCGRSTRP